jgi:nucleoside phosphorylase
MGHANAKHAIRAALETQKPSLVLSCGFAGGLRQDLATGTVVFAADGQPELTAALVKAGARPTRFHCAPDVVTTSDQKRLLRVTTVMEAVEMESQVVCGICQEKEIPCAIVRVILDTADEDLPLDFNALMTADQQMDYGKLALVLIKSPGKIGALFRLQKQSRSAAVKLAEVLEKVTV